MKIVQADVLIVGAGPSGAVAAGILNQGEDKREVLVLERGTFPRFSIGESLLPQSMAFFEEAGMLPAIVEQGFQYKNGAQFLHQGQYTHFDFRDKFSTGWGTTYQVQRADFDKVLIDEVIKQGVAVRFSQEVVAYHYDVQSRKNWVTVKDHIQKIEYQVCCQFVLDASGFARVLPRLLDLEVPSNFPTRQAIFTHVNDHIPVGTFDRNKILVTVHPSHTDVWFWLIPFSDGRCSLGVVAEQSFFDSMMGTNEEKLKHLVADEPDLSDLLSRAHWPNPIQTIIGYSANVKSLVGPGYALLGNAGEFLDPVFSSGITIAVKSASLAANCLKQEKKGEPVDWILDYERPLKLGVNAFRAYVEAWYDGSFQKIIFSSKQQPEVRRMIASILAGYAWDVDNPFVEKAKQRLKVIHELCEG